MKAMIRSLSLPLHSTGGLATWSESGHFSLGSSFQVFCHSSPNSKVHTRTFVSRRLIRRKQDGFMPCISLKQGIRRIYNPSEILPASINRKVSSKTGNSGKPDSSNTSPWPAIEPIAHYEGAFQTTFKRLKIFSLGSLSLATIMCPIILVCPGELPLSARCSLAIAALATSAVSTGMIAWIGLPYVAKMRLRNRKEVFEEMRHSSTILNKQPHNNQYQNVAGSNDVPCIEAITTNWRARSIKTTIFDPSFIRPTSRPFATWELSNTPLSSSNPFTQDGSNSPSQHSPTENRLLVAESVDEASGKIIGRWWALWKLSTSLQPDNDGKSVAIGSCESEGSPVRYFSVHEELLTDDWRVL